MKDDELGAKVVRLGLKEMHTEFWWGNVRLLGIPRRRRQIILK